MEVQFEIQENPPSLTGRELTISGIDRILEAMDWKVLSLFKKAGQFAWSSRADKLSNSRVNAKTLEREIVTYIVEHGAKDFGLWFCGDAESVGTAVYVELTAYLSRAIRLPDGSNPEWMQNLTTTGSSKGTSMVLVAISLRAAAIDFDLPELIRDFDEPEPQQKP